MKTFLPLALFFVLLASSIKAQTLYSNNTLAGNIYNPGSSAQGNPKIVLDDVSVPSALVGGSDSITVTRIKFGIYRPANAPATTVRFYFSAVEDSATSYNTLISIPPRLIGTANFPVQGATASQYTVSVGDSINPLFRVKADTGAIYTGFSTFFIGTSFSNASASWRFATGGNNDDVMWVYNGDSTVPRFATYFGGTPKASFAAEVFGKTAVTMPVTLSSFKATYQNNNSVLSWSTQSEANSSYFDVEASSDGVNYTSLGKVNAAGTSTTTKNYNYVHVKPTAGIYHYRLKMVDKDNTFKYSSVERIVVEKEHRIALTIMPNPVAQSLQFNWNEEGQFKFKMSDLQGKQLLAGNVQKGMNRVNISALAGGIYMLSVIDNKGQIIATEQLHKR